MTDRHGPEKLSRTTDDALRAPSLFDSQRLTVAADGVPYSPFQIHLLHRYVNNWLSLHEAESSTHNFDSLREKPCLGRLLDPTGRLRAAGVGVYSIFNDEICSTNEGGLTAGWPPAPTFFQMREIENLKHRPPILSIFPIDTPNPAGPRFALVIRESAKKSYAHISPHAFVEWLSGNSQALIEEWTRLNSPVTTSESAYLGPMLGTVHQGQLRWDISLGTHTLIAGREPGERIDPNPLFREPSTKVAQLLEDAALVAMRGFGLVDESYSFSSEEPALHLRGERIPLTAREIFELADSFVYPKLIEDHSTSEGLANKVGFYWESLGLAREIQLGLCAIIDPTEQRPAFISVNPIDGSNFLHQEGGSNIIASMETSGRTVYLSSGFVKRLLRHPHAEEVLAATLVTCIATSRKCQDAQIVQTLVKLVDQHGQLASLMREMADEDRPLPRGERDKLVFVAKAMEGERLGNARKNTAMELALKFPYKGPLFSSIAPIKQLPLTPNSLPTEMGETPFRSIGFNLSLLSRVTQLMTEYEREVLVQCEEDPRLIHDEYDSQEAPELSTQRIPVYRLRINLDGSGIADLPESEIMSLFSAHGLSARTAVEVIELFTDSLLISEGLSSSLFGVEHLSDRMRRTLSDTTRYYFDGSGNRASLNIGWVLRSLIERLKSYDMPENTRDFQLINLADKIAYLDCVVRDGFMQGTLFQTKKSR